MEVNDHGYQGKYALWGCSNTEHDYCKVEEAMRDKAYDAPKLVATNSKLNDNLCIGN